MEKTKSKDRRQLKIKPQPEGYSSDHRHPCGQYEEKHNMLFYKIFSKEIKTVAQHNNILKRDKLWKIGMKNNKSISKSQKTLQILVARIYILNTLAH